MILKKINLSQPKYWYRKGDFLLCKSWIGHKKRYNTYTLYEEFCLKDGDIFSVVNRGLNQIFLFRKKNTYYISDMAFAGEFTEIIM